VTNHRGHCWPAAILMRSGRRKLSATLSVASDDCLGTPANNTDKCYGTKCPPERPARICAPQKSTAGAGRFPSKGKGLREPNRPTRERRRTVRPWLGRGSGHGGASALFFFFLPSGHQVSATEHGPFNQKYGGVRYAASGGRHHTNQAGPMEKLGRDMGRIGGSADARVGKPWEWMGNTRSGTSLGRSTRKTRAHRPVVGVTDHG